MTHLDQRQRLGIGHVGLGDMANPIAKTIGSLGKIIAKSVASNKIVGTPFSVKDDMENYVTSEIRRGALPKKNQKYFDSFDDNVYYHATTQDIKKFDPYSQPETGAFRGEGEVDPRGATYFTSDPKLANEVLDYYRRAEIQDILNEQDKAFSAYGLQDLMKKNPNFDYKPPYDEDIFGTYKKQMSDIQSSVGKQFTEGSQIYPVKIKTKDIFDYDNPDHIDKLENKILATFSDESEEFDYLGRVKAGNWQALEQDYIKDALKKLGYSGYRTNESGTIGVFNSDKGDVRSLYAKFDPKQEKSGEILASIVPYASVGTIGALSGLDEGT